MVLLTIKIHYKYVNKHMKQIILLLVIVIRIYFGHFFNQNSADEFFSTRE